MKKNLRVKSEVVRKLAVHNLAPADLREVVGGATGMPSKDPYTRCACPDQT